MKIALDPFMLRHVPLTELPAVVAELGYEYIELSPREDFTPFFLHPRASTERVREFRAALAAAGVQVASHLPLYRWSGPDEDERQAAARHWKRAIELTVDLGCDVMNSEFNGRPEAPSASEAQFWRSLAELLRGGTETAIRCSPAACAAAGACWLCARGRAGTAGCRPRVRPEPSGGLSSR
jgi:myo-inositol catabolism protein IolH